MLQLNSEQSEAMKGLLDECESDFDLALVDSRLVNYFATDHPIIATAMFLRRNLSSNKTGPFVPRRELELIS